MKDKGWQIVDRLFAAMRQYGPKQAIKDPKGFKEYLMSGKLPDMEKAEAVGDAFGDAFDSSEDKEPRVEVDFDSNEVYPLVGGHVIVNDTRFMFVSPGPDARCCNDQLIAPGAIVFTAEGGDRLPYPSEIHAGLRALLDHFPDREVFIRTNLGLRRVSRGSPIDV